MRLWKLWSYLHINARGPIFHCVLCLACKFFFFVCAGFCFLLPLCGSDPHCLIRTQNSVFKLSFFPQILFWLFYLRCTSWAGQLSAATTFLLLTTINTHVMNKYILIGLRGTSMTSHLFVHLLSLLSDSHAGTTAPCLLSDPLTVERRRRGRRRKKRRRPQSSCNSHIPLSHSQTQFILCTASCWRQDRDGRVGGVEASSTVNFKKYQKGKKYTKPHTECMCCLFPHFKMLYEWKKVPLSKLQKATRCFVTFCCLLNFVTTAAGNKAHIFVLFKCSVKLPYT